MTANTKLISKLIVGISASVLALYATSAVYARDNDTTTSLGPTIALGYTGTLTPVSAYSLLGEVAPKNYRVGATLGYAFNEVTRFKVSGEWLWQRINFGFYTGSTERWVNQGAIGADLQYDFAGWDFGPQFDIGGFYSHANSYSLGTISGTRINSVGTPMPFTDLRRLAGADAGGASAGLSARPWMGGKIGLALDWDTATYNTHYSSGHKNVNGFGGTAFFNQGLTENVSFGALAQVRSLFNNYEAELDYNNFYYMGRWKLGLFGDYTTGKNTLPNTWNAGISLNYFADCIMPPSLKGEAAMAVASNAEFLNWVQDPAVYMPQVLVITDERLRNSCAAPILTSPIPPINIESSSAVFITVPAGSHFSGTGLTFSATGLPNGVTIDATTGVISGFVQITTLPMVFPVVVIATNTCTSATTTFTIRESTIPN